MNYNSQFIFHKILFFMIALLCVSTPLYSETREVKVGFYENYPKVFTAKDGLADGIFIDVIEDIAQKEEWKLNFIHGTWEECLSRLENSEIDLMIDVAYSLEREKIYDFTRQDVIANWAQIYTKEGYSIKLFTDLNGKTIASLRKGIHGSRFKAIADGFGLKYKLLLVDDYETVFQLLDEKKVDAGIVNRIYGTANRDKYTITPSPVLFSPASLRYAVKKGYNNDLIIAIDKNLAEMKASKISSYHQTIRYWLGETSKLKLPLWVIWTIMSTAFVVVLLLIMSMLLKHQVNRKTLYLQRINSELEKQVAETMKVYRQLQEKEEKLIQQERLSALGQLTAGIAHDFNNQLIPVIGYPDLILESPEILQDKKMTLKMLDNIRHSAIESRDIIKRLQLFTKADMFIKMEKVKIARLFDEVIQATRPLWKSEKEAKSIQISITKDVSPELMAVFSKNQINEALMNLVINSLHSMSRDGKIILKAYLEGDKLCLAVADTGKGMSRSVQKRCLEPFYSTKGELGTGMGLSMVYGIVKRHDGLMSITSEPDRGTEIIITIPYLQNEIPGIGSVSSSEYNNKELKILMVDDDENSRILVGEYLKHDGHKASIAESVDQALVLFEQHKYDLIITDQSMPGKSGLDLANHIKSINPEIPILMISGFARVMFDDNGLPKTIDYLLAKPFTLNELRDAISIVICRYSE